MNATTHLLQVADGLVAELNAAVLPAAGHEPVAQRLYVPLFELPTLRDLHVSVVPKAVSIEQIARGIARQDHDVDIAVQRRVDPDATPDLDALMALIGAMESHFHGRRLTSFPAAAWVRSRFEPVYAPEHLHPQRVFTSVLTLTFRVTQGVTT